MSGGELAVCALSLLAATLGALGGLGGAVLLVPALVVTGTSPLAAAPLGLLCVAAGSIAAAPRQLVARTVNHRLGITVELVATSAAVAGALLAGAVGERALRLGLAVVALLAAVAGAHRSGMRNLPDPECDREAVGERVGQLAGVYPLDGQVVPYAVRRVPAGLAVMALAGFVAGTSGASGGFLKTPALTEVMHVPVRVAAATTTFTVGITSAAALCVFAVQGRLDVDLVGPVVLGSLLGGVLGARVQGALRPVLVRRVLSALLVAVAVVLGAGA